MTNCRRCGRRRPILASRDRPQVFRLRPPTLLARGAPATRLTAEPLAAVTPSARVESAAGRPKAGRSLDEARVKTVPAADVRRQRVRAEVAGAGPVTAAHQAKAPGPEGEAFCVAQGRGTVPARGG